MNKNHEEFYKEMGDLFGITPEETREYAIDFAYTNGKLANNNLTREMVEKACDEFEEKLEA